MKTALLRFLLPRLNRPWACRYFDHPWRFALNMSTGNMERVCPRWKVTQTWEM